MIAWLESFEKALLKLRSASEKQWKQMPEWVFDPEEDVGGHHWSHETRWCAAYDDTKIAALEAELGCRLPDDYRAYLRILNGTTPRRKGAWYEGDELVPSTAPGFYSWDTDRAEMEAARRRVLDGIVFDVERANVWHAAWGVRIPGKERELLEQRIRAAPRLIPIFGHRHLLALDEQGPNPVLSVHQTDIIVYGDDLLSYLRNELDLTTPKQPAAMRALPKPNFAAIPFWGPML